MKVNQFSAPGNLTDLDADMAKGWSDFISRTLDGEVRGLLQGQADIQAQFYNPSKLDISGTAAPISWPAFPGRLSESFSDDQETMFQMGEQRPNQDEYLEWAVTTKAGKITRVMFTCEGPEYWKFIAANRPALLVELYTKLVGQPVPKKDLISKHGTYQPQNKWNLQHAIHLIQGANTLGAEMNIAAQATILRRHGTELITDPIELIDCSRFGVRDRNSDPHIGDVVNQKARLGCSVTLQNPVGLYLESLPEPAKLGFLKPDGSPVGNYWTLVRGDTDHILRAVYEVPAGETSGGHPFVVGDLTSDGAPLRFGGQIAQKLRVKLTGIIGQEGVFHNKSFPCPGQEAGPLLAAMNLNASGRQV